MSRKLSVAYKYNNRTGQVWVRWGIAGLITRVQVDRMKDKGVEYNFNFWDLKK